MSVEDLDFDCRNRFKMFSNGQEVIEFLDKLLTEVDEKSINETETPQQPV